MSKKANQNKPTSVRKLAAILFSDITGYTSMMQNDEKGALVLLERYRECHENEAKRHNGKIVQYYGDACLMIFDSAYDAVRCGEDLQLAFREGIKVPVRVGLHLGDVVHQEGNVFGDAVNVASRVESMGVPGAVLFSETIRISIKGHPELVHQSLGSFEFKNVDNPIEVFALSCHGFPIPKKEEIKGKFKEKPKAERKVQKATKRKPFPVQRVLAGIGLVSVLGLLMWSFGGFSSKPAKSDAVASKGKVEIVQVKPEASGVYSDARDGEQYPWQDYGEIGKWMTQNLRYEMKGTSCYKNKIVCDELGRLYTWDAAISACPDGWKLPTKEEWQRLIKKFGGDTKAYPSLMQKGNNGFGAQLGGVLDDEGSYNYLGEAGDYWTSSEPEKGKALFYNFNKDRSKIYELVDSKKLSFSCRCIAGEKQKVATYIVDVAVNSPRSNLGSSESNAGVDRSYNQSENENLNEVNPSSGVTDPVEVIFEYARSGSRNTDRVELSILESGIDADLKIGSRTQESKDKFLVLETSKSFSQNESLRIKMTGPGSAVYYSLEEGRLVEVLQNLGGDPGLDVDGDLKIGKKPSRMDATDEIRLLLISNRQLDSYGLLNRINTQSGNTLTEKIEESINESLLAQHSDHLQFTGSELLANMPSSSKVVIPVLISIKRQ